MTRTLFGAHAKQCRYHLTADLEARVCADTTPITAHVVVIAAAKVPHREVAKQLRMLAKEIEAQP